MATATLLIERCVTWCGHVNIYMLDEPYAGADHVAVEVFDTAEGWQNAGVQVIACDATGSATSMNALFQSYVVATHEETLTTLGYTLTEPTDPETP